MKTTYIVSAHRTAVGKAPRGLFRFKRPDELAAETIEYMMSNLPDFDVTTIDDVLGILVRWYYVYESIYSIDKLLMTTAGGVPKHRESRREQR